MVERIEGLRQAECVFREDGQLERPHGHVHDLVQPRRLQHQAPQLVGFGAGVERVAADRAKLGDDVRFVKPFALAELRENVVGADDGVLHVRSGFALEAQRFVDVERDDLAA